MRWKDRADMIVETILVVGVVLGIIVMFVLLLSTYAKADACLTIDLEPKNVPYNYDGDTYAVDMGPFGLWHIREEGIDTPERNKKEPGWEEAKDFTWAWLHEGHFQLETCFALTFGRVVGSSSRNGVTLADALRAAGHTK